AYRLARRVPVRSLHSVLHPTRSTVMRLPLTMLAVALIAVPAHASELTGTLQKVKETNKIILGIQEASVPFSYLDGDQKAIGYAVDICMRIVDAVKREINVSNVAVETLPVTSSNRIPLMMNGTVDLVCRLLLEKKKYK